ncbi:MAG: hypothetical protein QM759_16585 [Terricaulis sp.]
MKLPNGERADIPLVRLSSYLLNPAHPTGKHKARVFAAALGLATADAPALQAWLQTLAREGEAIDGLRDSHGQRFAISGEFTYNGRLAMVRTAWIVRAGRDYPEFLTAFVE